MSYDLRVWEGVMYIMKKIEVFPVQASVLCGRLHEAAAHILTTAGPVIYNRLMVLKELRMREGKAPNSPSSLRPPVVTCRHV